MTLYGTTTGHYGSPHRTQTLAGATLAFYPAKPSNDRSRWSWHAIDEIPDNAVGTAVVQDDGSFTAELDYQGAAVLVAAEVNQLSYAPNTGQTARGFLGTGMIGGEQQTLSIDLAAQDYCALLRALDLWLVAGRVTNCGQPVVPADNATVTVFDRDWTQDDTLGMDVTDGAGSFEVFFPRSTFHQIPVIPPPFDWIQPHELFGGPDVFCRVERGGVTLVDEAPSVGRTTDRQNRPNCTYLELCAEVPDVQEDDFTGWTHIGIYQVEDGTNLNDFDSERFVDAGKLAFTKSIDLHGTVAQTTNGSPTRYRFLIAKWDTLTTAPTAPTSPTDLGDYAPLTTEITSQPYGAIYDTSQPFPVITSKVSPNPDADGWVDVEQSPDFDRPSGYPLVQVDTRKIVPAIDMGSPSTANAGEETPAAHRDEPKKFSIMLEVSDGTTTQAQPPVTLHINNSLAYTRLQLEELESNACTPITRSGSDVTINPRFTVAHPYLGSYRLWMQRQGGPEATISEDDFSGHGSLWTDADGVFTDDASTPPDVPASEKEFTYGHAAQCSYRVWLSVSRRLTTGRDTGGASQGLLLVTFCTP